MHSLVGSHMAEVRRLESEYQVAVDLVPVHLGEEAAVSWSGGSLSARLASTGNPHAIIMVPEGEPKAIDDMLAAAMAAFNGQRNVHLVDVISPGSARMWTRERGVGPVRACATGAAAAATVLAGGHQSGWDIEMPGGVLHIVPGNAETAAQTRGPAMFVCAGSWSCPPDVYPPLAT